MDIEHAQIGRRVREIRNWRGLSLSAAAGLAGLSVSYLSMIERGQRVVTKRQTLEAIANALRVAPTDLTDSPWASADPVGGAAQSTLVRIEAALTEWRPGEVPDDARPRPLAQVRADVTLLVEKLRPTSDYAGQGAIIPDLIHDLLIHAGNDRHRTFALRALAGVYHAAGNLAARLGTRHLGYVASERVQQSAELLDDSAWLGVSAWTRAQFVSSVSRQRQYQLAVAAADVDGARLESRGMAHLTAALASAAQGDEAAASTHLDEASRMAELLDSDNSTWGAATMNFGRANVGIWRVSIGAETGAGGRLVEVARNVPWQAVPQSRQGAFWMDLGRGLLGAGGKHYSAGLRALLQAEQLTPQQVRNNVFAREAVSGALASVRREAGGRDLRGLAWRMGVAPIG